ncbi:MAG: right-handed parallel beta-helix repeat-containing protein [Bacteroidetes bacterium]|nr:right-handed parallel beta-helix repeat-containing protein [Bacteroidota bacterium]
MKKTILLTFALGSLNVFSQTNYYVSSSSGNNGYDGWTSGSAWADFTNFAGVILGADDTVFIKSGDIIEDSLRIVGTGMPDHPIVITSYGTGAKPIISGSHQLTGWSAGPVQTIASADTVRCLVVNENQESYARYPDTDFLIADNSTTTTGFIDNELPASPDYTGAKVCVHTSLWTWESITVLNHSTTSITFDGATNEPTVAPDYDGFGYFFFDRPDLINLPGEWSWQSGTVYYYPAAGIDPNTDDVQGIVLDCGIRIPGNTDYVTISNIEFRNQYEAGIKASHGGSSGIRIENCDFKNGVQCGIFLRGSSHVIAQNNFDYIDGRAISGGNCTNVEIHDNVLTHTGMFRNYGLHSDDNLVAICMQGGNQNYIHHNRVDSCGYSGIRCDGTDAVVERNAISHYMMLLSDGGGVKSFGSLSDNVIYRNNILSYGLFNHAGTPTSNEHIQSAALYFDFDVLNSTFENNVIQEGFETGIFLNGGSNNCVVRNNVIYGGSHHILLNDRDNPDSIYADTIEFNKCFALADTTINIRINSVNDYYVGVIDSNWYFNPYSTTNIGKLIGTIGGGSGIEYSFADWQNVLGFDANSHESFVSWGPSENYSEIFVNDTDVPVTFPLGPNKYLDLDSNVICTEITVDPWYAEILINTGEPCGLGIQESDENFVHLYPNPATTNVQIQAAGNQTIHAIEIYAADGSVVYSQKMLNQTLISVDLSNFESGIYFVQITTGQDVQTKRLIKP